MRITNTTFIVLSLLLLAIFGCKTSDRTATKSTEQPGRLAFYNVENLFDTQDDPQTFDEEFTPTGKKQWTEKRYQTKLNNLCRVVEGMAYPQLIGLCEIENAQTLKDFIEKTTLSEHAYQFVHYDSPDKRGIDVALLYQSSIFKVLDSKAIPIHFPQEVIPDMPDYTTRDILYVKGLYRNRDSLHLFVNHWPSRRGGVEASEPKRLFVASELRKQIDGIFTKNTKAKIILMGDFNDETDNKSILSKLQAARTAGPPDRFDYLYNCSAALDRSGEGTYKYKDNWNMLDQIIVSAALIDPSASLSASPASIYQADWMIYEDKKYGRRPSKTYGGPNYYGGSSDHFPVYIDLKASK